MTLTCAPAPAWTHGWTQVDVSVPFQSITANNSSSDVRHVMMVAHRHMYDTTKAKDRDPWLSKVTLATDRLNLSLD